MDLIRARFTSAIPALSELLERHPQVAVEAGETAPQEAINFSQGSWERSVDIVPSGTAGLIELMDNNPMVCSDRVGIPSPSGTLALIAVGPLIRAGLLVEAPTLMFGFDVTEEMETESWLQTMDWHEGASVVGAPQDTGSVLALTAMAVIDTTAFAPNYEVIDELYEESYGRSFFVHEAGNEPWDTSLVADKAHAVYRLGITPDAPYSLLRIQVMADKDGKCGAKQFVHAMNVMAGLEESIGIA